MEAAVRPNPFADVLQFLTKPAWFTVVFWLLLIASIWLARSVWTRDGSQRSGYHIGRWLLRLLVGAMWWQQSLWKIPSNFDGLIYWMRQEVDHASFALQSDFVSGIVLPHILLFGPLVYAIEVAIGVSLMLGVWSRGGALLGALMAINLWLGLYSAPGEWPWTYMFLIIIQALFVLDPPGRSLGVDAQRRGRRGRDLGILTSALS
jgi:uncharacterized membrane protein YphA (DoxX/SURF4 family)